MMRIFDKNKTGRAEVRARKRKITYRTLILSLMLCVCAALCLTSCGGRNIGEDISAGTASVYRDGGDGGAEDPGEGGGDTAAQADTGVINTGEESVLETAEVVGGETAGTAGESSAPASAEETSDNADAAADTADTAESAESGYQSAASQDAPAEAYEQQASGSNVSDNQSGAAAPAADTYSENTCSILVDCSTIFDNKDKIRESILNAQPADGVILSIENLSFTPGETAFDILQRLMRENGIPMEFSQSPAYNSKYVEGINNLYEFDCGERSGWMYSVNGEFLNYGSSSVEIKSGDRIQWRYTCDLGEDLT